MYIDLIDNVPSLDERKEHKEAIRIYVDESEEPSWEKCQRRTCGGHLQLASAIECDSCGL